MKETKGLFAAIQDAANQHLSIGNITEAQFKKVLEDIESKDIIQEDRIINAGFILSLPDDIFTAFCTAPHITVIGSIDTVNQIQERMKKLGI